MNKLHQAENRANSLRGKRNHAHHKRNKCHWYQVGCKVKWESRYLAYGAAYSVAEGVLHAVEKAIDIFPIDLDPRVAPLLAARDIAIVALKSAEYAVEGVELLDTIVEKVFDAVVNGLNEAKPIVINKLAFEGSLAGASQHGEPWLLEMDYAIFKKPFDNKFVFKLDDPVYDAKQLGLVALQTIDYVIEDGLKEIPVPLKRRFHEAIGSRIEKLAKINSQDMKKHRKEFEEVKHREKSLKNKMKRADEKRTKRLEKEISSNLDVEPKSLELKSVMLELGHSGLCLTNIGGAEVAQLPCNDTKAGQRWSTKATKQGFVSFRNAGDCMQPIDATSDLAVQLHLDACNQKEPAQDWKVQTHDKDFYRVANRASGKCLHFVDPSANPMAVTASWWPCHGADAQSFRVLKNTKPVFHKVDTVVGSVRSGLCLGTSRGKHLKNQSYSWFFRDINKQITHAKEGVLAGNCLSIAANKKKPELEGFFFNYVETFDGYIKVVDKWGNCLFPESRKSGSGVVSRPCDHSDDQYWEKDEAGGGFRLKNKKSKLCIDVVNNPASRSWKVVQLTCNTHSNQVMSFGVPKTGLEWGHATKDTMANVMKKARERKSNKVKIFNAGRYDRQTKKWLDLALVCRAKTTKGSKIGAVADSGSCKVAFDKDTAHSYSKYDILKKAENGVWIKSAGPNPPFDAAASARHGFDIYYTCRTEQEGKLHVGWASEGTCRYANGKKAGVSGDFQYLVTE